MERFPNWLPNPDVFWDLGDEEKVKLMTYNHIRMAEELEIAFGGM